MIQDDAVQFIQEGKKAVLNLKIQGQGIALQGEGEVIGIFRPKEFEDRQEGAPASRGNPAQDGPEARKTGVLGQNQLILGEPPPAI